MIDDVRPPERPAPKPKVPADSPEVAVDNSPAPVEQDPPAQAEPARKTDDMDIETIELPDKPDKTDKPKRWQRFLPKTKKQKIIVGILVAVIILGGGAGAWMATHHKQTPVKKVAAIKPAKPKQVLYSKLSGLPIADDSSNNQPVVAVMVENSLDARPQSGLSNAGIVYEAVAEGGITRFMALYQGDLPSNVGPVRSARPYYVSWALGYNAVYAHVGGSPDALSDIAAWGVQDLNQFYNDSAYKRIDSRAAPHNVYTNVNSLLQLAATKGLNDTGYTPFDRKADQPYTAPKPAAGKPASKSVDNRIAANSIDISISGADYDPHYDYIASTNSYARSEAGQAQTDDNTGKQLSPKVVVAIVLPLTQGALDASGAYYSNYNTLGSGQAVVFQDGVVEQATWHKDINSDSLTLTDTNGKALKLNRGQTWITAVTAPNKVSYK